MPGWFDVPITGSASFRARSKAVAERLERLYPRLAELAAQAAAVPPGVEWILDNHFVLRRAAREVRVGLGRGFTRRLPIASELEPGATPIRRIEARARTILREVDGLLDRASLIRAVEQPIGPDPRGVDQGTSLAELWALPLLLRLLLLEQLETDATRLIRARRGPGELVEQRRVVDGDEPDEPRVAHAVRSLLWIEKTDWARFVERVSEVHRILGDDPSGQYAGMDFETRDRYRGAVERLARSLGSPEREIADRVVALANAGIAAVDPRHRHIGYYLLDDGRAQLDGSSDAATRHRRRTWAYLGAIAGGTASLLGALVWVLVDPLDSGAVWKVGIAAALAFLPMWTLSVTAVHGLLARWLRPRPLAKLGFGAGGIPASCRTLLVVPGLLTQRRDADALIDNLEAHYLATRDPQLDVAMLTDFGDADAATSDEDAELLEYARERVRALNHRYASEAEGPFHLLHRRRVWSPQQGRWMGWERKRGKLDELNRLLRGATDTTYMVHEGRPDRLLGIRYVLTLDADTILPIGAAQRLIETLAHPLNVARVDADGRTVAGYTVLQPRVELAPETAATWFARTCAGDGAFDIYTRAVSDVYQDLFGEGVFVGKGLYDLDAFHASVADQLPNDRVLSHDLLEGIHGRVGLVSDVVVYEDYPSHYVAAARRLHRWIRGDWQLLAWLRRTVPTTHGARRNRLSVISRWKILDNLRRSGLIASLVVFVVFAWFALPGPAWVWTLAVATVLAAPRLAEFGGQVAQAGHAVLRPWLGVSTGAGRWTAARYGLGLCVMVHEAGNSLDAIARALIRTKVTHRQQLEWLPAAVTGRGAATSTVALRVLGPAVGVAVAIGLGLAWLRPSALLGASPLLVAWILAPIVVVWTGRVSQPPREPEASRPVDRAAMRRLARRTWAFYERVVGPADHWLPPDHLQEQPKAVIAHRTSPTNIAMALLSTVVAHELGYFDVLELVIRLRNTIESLGQLPRHRGHIYNWCDTTTLTPLEPRYVSTVDSGNLAAALLIIEQSCRELGDGARPFEHRCEGLADSLGVFAEELRRWGPEAASVERRVEAMRAALAQVTSPADWLPALASLDEPSFIALDRELLVLFEAEHAEHAGRTEHDPAAFEQLRGWAGQIRRDVGHLRRELDVQLPWLAGITVTPGPVPNSLAPVLATLRSELAQLPSLAEVAPAGARALVQISIGLALDDLPPGWRRWLEQLEVGLRASLEYTLTLRERLHDLAERSAALVAGMDFGFLYDPERELMYIGYDASAERFDEHHYDLLASEARVASLIAIAKGEVPVRHWAKLGRPIGRFGAGRGLLSWSGTMFEYLMPPLLIDEGEGTLLDVSVRAAVREQIEFGRRNQVPWGVSESGYARVDNHQNYQYRAFGVAATGFRREVDPDLVIAPYASLIALRYEPRAVEQNLARITALGGLGPLGVYEALDFTPARLELGDSHVVVRSYMAHHQGMIMLALHAHLFDRGLVARAHRHPLLRSVELLLRERPPGRVAPVERAQPVAGAPALQGRPPRVQPWSAMPNQVAAHVLGNGRYTVLISSDGAGQSSWKKLALTAASHDPVLADDGFAIRLRERTTGQRWQFHAERTDDSVREVEFSAHGARIAVHRDELLAELEICVALDCDAELRVVRLTERGGRRRQLSLTGYAELALADPRAYARHPAFSKLFVQSQLHTSPTGPTAIVCQRRPREPDEAGVWFGCALISDQLRWTRYEIDRRACLGRGPNTPNGELHLRPIPSEAEGMTATLDACVALGAEFELGPYETRECAFVLFAADSRAELLERATQLASMGSLRRLVLATRADAQARAERRGHTTDRLARFQRLLSAVVYPRRRAQATHGIESLSGQPGLWRHGISGDRPLLVARVGAVGISTVVELLRAHEHWRTRGLAIDLVLLEQQAIGYGGDLRQRLSQAIERERAPLEASDGGVFLLAAGALADHELALLLATAALVVDADVDDLDRLDLALDHSRIAPLPMFEPEGQPEPWTPTPALERPTDLLLDNGFGGFTPDGREYVIHLEPGRSTPAPWVNVLANPEFGCVVSERGSGYTWSGNAGLHRLSAWSNDAVLDPPSESLYLRDELDGAVWSPLPAPAGSAETVQIRHGAGYTQFRQHSHGLIQRVELFVDPEHPVKFVQLELTNVWTCRRRLTVTLCVEWLLGGQRPDDVRLLTTDFEPLDEVALARNPWNPAFADRWAFVAASERLHGMTGSREEFFGRAGSRATPAALARIGLSGETSHGRDACTALQIHVELEPGATTAIHFMIGATQDRAAAIALAKRCRSKPYMAERRRALTAAWDRLLGAVEVRTPDPRFDVMTNRWLLYQCISARLWGRTGFQQSSGAFGFRDQLQDVLALIHTAPERVRAHLLDAASRQYEAGDVQHWWHPPAGQGLRSRCSDDLLWLPLVTAAYVHATGDVAVLAERARFLDQPVLAPNELERYESEPRWGRDGSLYEHCMLALERGRSSGVHGLPLIGTGDWNDGFSHVGSAGRGESVWLAWFYATVAREFAQVCVRLGQASDADALLSVAASLAEPAERAWDGAWYRRAYTDDGAVIGGEQSPACKIDSLAQSWAVISKLGDPIRAREGMQSVWQRLVVPDRNLIKLFTPAFANARPKLGYIEAYPPGVRENGGQYSHAAVWVAWAFSELGEHDRAYEVWSMLNPLAHTTTRDSAERYRVEPYVMAADIYAELPHVGRGGWTWYTGAAGWAYRMAIERIVGLTRVDGRLWLDPRRMPSAWPTFELIVREGEVARSLRIDRRPAGDSDTAVRIAGVAQTLPIPLFDRAAEERVLVISIPAA